MKTAISIPDDLYYKVEDLAHETHCSRSKLFALAMQEYINKAEAKNLLDRLNEVYADEAEQLDNAKMVEAGSRHFLTKVAKNKY